MNYYNSAKNIGRQSMQQIKFIQRTKFMYSDSPPKSKHCEYNPTEMIWSQIKGYVASHNVKWTSLINMRQLVLEAFSSISPQYCQKVCDHVKHLEEVTIQAEMAMVPIVEQMIVKVGDSSNEDSDVELEETPPLIANTKSNEDQIIQKIIREHDKLYPTKKIPAVHWMCL